MAKRTAAPFLGLLKACAEEKDLFKGSRLHADFVRRGLLEKSTYIGSSLISMYVKCGSIMRAEQVMDELPVHDVVTWNALISGYARQGQVEKALTCLEQMQREGFAANVVTFTSILKACSRTSAIDKGIRVHSDIVKQGLADKEIVIGNSLVDMYAKCGVMTKAQEVLDELLVRDVISWSALIIGYTQGGQSKEALKSFECMQHDGITPNTVTFIGILKACGNLTATDKGKQIHAEIIKLDLIGKNVVLDSALVDMYAKCDALTQAQEVLDELPVRNVVSWNALMEAYTLQGQDREVFKRYEQMQWEGLFPNLVTFICLLRACGSTRDASKGIEIHDDILNQGLDVKDLMLGTALIDMYVKCGALPLAQQVFDDLPLRDVALWNVLIAGYVKEGQGDAAFSCFDQMQSDCLFPNAVSLIYMLNACGNIRSLDKGKQLFDEIVGNKSFVGKVNVIISALMSMCNKCGAPMLARQVLNDVSVRDAIMWNAVLTGYAQQGEGEEVLCCFEWMQREGFVPDDVTFISILKACGSLGAFARGQQIHNEIVNQGLVEKSLALGTALIDMYAKCGSLVEALQVLSEFPVRDVVCWNTLIAGYAQHGQGKEALNCLEQMQIDGLSPDAITFVCVLNACSRLGFVHKCQDYLMNMSWKYRVIPTIHHYTCMIDVLGRVGHFDMAVGTIKGISFCCDRPVWSALLSACLKGGKVNLGQWTFKQAS